MGKKFEKSNWQIAEEALLKVLPNINFSAHSGDEYRRVRVIDLCRDIVQQTDGHERIETR